MNDNQAKQWAQTRAQGRANFIWKYGILAWGLTTGVAWAVVMSYIEGWWSLAFLLPLALVFFPIGGYFYGAILWRWMESSFERSQSNAQHSP